MYLIHPRHSDFTFTQPTKNISAFTAVLGTSLLRKLSQKINKTLTKSYRHRILLSSYHVVHVSLSLQALRSHARNYDIQHLHTNIKGSVGLVWAQY